MPFRIDNPEDTEVIAYLKQQITASGMTLNQFSALQVGMHASQMSAIINQLRPVPVWLSQWAVDRQQGDYYRRKVGGHPDEIEWTCGPDQWQEQLGIGYSKPLRGEAAKRVREYIRAELRASGLPKYRFAPAQMGISSAYLHRILYRTEEPLPGWIARWASDRREGKLWRRAYKRGQDRGRPSEGNEQVPVVDGKTY